MFKTITICFLLSIAISSCSQNRTYLTEKEKSWNPYKEGQVLIFESSNYEKDTIRIEDINFGFPDGLGIVDYYEILDVLAEPTGPDLGKYFSNIYGVLTIAAKTEKRSNYVEFGIKVKNAQFIERQRFSFEELEGLAEIQFTVPYGAFDDVIVIDNKRDYSSTPTAIEIIHWSKSKGYIWFDKYDGVSWELVKIIEPLEIT